MTRLFFPDLILDLYKCQHSSSLVSSINNINSFTVSGAIGITKNSNSVQVYPPIICGENSGQHMYLNAGRASSDNITLSNRGVLKTYIDR